MMIYCGTLDDIYLEISKRNKWLKLSYQENGVEIEYPLEKGGS
jgi:hypothetical protein